MWSASFTVFLLKDRNAKDTPQTDASESSMGTVENARIDYYYARSEGGKVCIYEVYTNGYTRLISSPDIVIQSLPEGDRESFEKGLILKDKESLASMIEDFSS